ncbi:MAG TPA: S-adenosylmethionine:tRNA ribosyltransferase-isomerase [Bryobacteraceae bacterium]|nr:S-adenosylmethionine:tRNA ribosyltransferase-isomerase [Bryobacteraceae bacterium]
MIVASQPTQRPPDARLLVVDALGCIHHAPRSALVQFLKPGDLAIANDAATMPASLAAVHLRTGELIEVRLAGRRSLAADDVREFSAVVFGAGDFHTRTEDRPAPPHLKSGDELRIGPLRAAVRALLGHPRLITLHFAGSPDAIWAGLAQQGRPIQYAHVPVPLALWDVWTPIAGPPVAFEPPSAGFALDWHLLAGVRARGVDFATITHAAGISSTGDPQLDHRLPLDEPYLIPEAAVRAIRRAQSHGGRIIAVGTTVVRALEHAASRGALRAGPGLATGRVNAETRLQVVNALLSGTHEPGTSHYELLRAFAGAATLQRITAELDGNRYRTHEFGDSVLIERQSYASADLYSTISLPHARSAAGLL